MKTLNKLHPRKLILFSFLLLCSTVAFSQTISLKDKGAFYQLTVWKSAAEAIISNNIDNKDAQRDYSVLKAGLDAAISQYLYEMNRRHCLARKFNKINTYYKSGSIAYNCKNKNVTAFKIELDEFVSNAKTFIYKYGYPDKSKAPAMVAIDPVAVITGLWGIFKDFKDLQSSKVEGLGTLLNSIRLISLGDLKK